MRYIYKIPNCLWDKMQRISRPNPIDKKKDTHTHIHFCTAIGFYLLLFHDVFIWFLLLFSLFSHSLCIFSMRRSYCIHLKSFYSPQPTTTIEKLWTKTTTSTETSGGAKIMKTSRKIEFIFFSSDAAFHFK